MYSPSPGLSPRPSDGRGVRVEGKGERGEGRGEGEPFFKHIFTMTDRGERNKFPKRSKSAELGNDLKFFIEELSLVFLTENADVSVERVEFQFRPAFANSNALKFEAGSEICGVQDPIPNCCKQVYMLESCLPDLCIGGLRSHSPSV